MGVARLLTALTVGMLAWALLALAEGVVWLGVLCRELGPLGALLAGLLVLATGRSRRQRHGAALLSASLVLAWPLWPLLRPVRLTPAPGPRLQVAEASLDGSAVSAERVATLLREQNPDVLAIVGMGDSALRTLTPALSSMPYRARGLGLDQRQGLWSRVPLRVAARESVASVRVGRCDVQLAVVALPSVFDLARKPERARAIRVLRDTDQSARSIWLGGLGSRPLAPDLTPVMARHRLRDTRIGHGLLATTPAWLGPLGLATDHILVRGFIAVRTRDTREPLGETAHRTVTASLELTDRRCR